MIGLLIKVESEPAPLLTPFLGRGQECLKKSETTISIHVSKDDSRKQDDILFTKERIKMGYIE